MSEEPEIITISDVRPLHCVRGIKQWFDEKGLDFRSFLARGIPAAEIEQLNDGFGNRILEHKRGK